MTNFDPEILRFPFYTDSILLLETTDSFRQEQRIEKKYGGYVVTPTVVFLWELLPPPLPLHPGCLFVPPNSLSDVYMQLGSFFYLHVIVYASFSFSTHLLLPPCAYLHTPFLLSALHIPLP